MTKRLSRLVFSLVLLVLAGAYIVLPDPLPVVADDIGVGLAAVVNVIAAIKPIFTGANS